MNSMFITRWDEPVLTPAPEKSGCVLHLAHFRFDTERRRDIAEEMLDKKLGNHHRALLAGCDLSLYILDEVLQPMMGTYGDDQGLSHDIERKLKQEYNRWARECIEQFGWTSLLVWNQNYQLYSDSIGPDGVFRMRCSSPLEKFMLGAVPEKHLFYTERQHEHQR